MQMAPPASFDAPITWGDQAGKASLVFFVDGPPQKKGAKFEFNFQMMLGNQSIGLPVSTQRFELHARNGTTGRQAPKEELTYVGGTDVVIGEPNCARGTVRCGNDGRYVKFDMTVMATPLPGAIMRVTLVHSDSREPFEAATLRATKRARGKLVDDDEEDKVMQLESKLLDMRKQLDSTIQLLHYSDLQLPASDGTVPALRAVLSESCEHMRNMFSQHMREASSGNVEFRLADGSLPTREALTTIVRAVHAPGWWDEKLPIEVLAEIIQLARGFLVAGGETCPMETDVLEPASRALVAAATRVSSTDRAEMWLAMLQSTQLELDAQAVNRPIDTLVLDACVRAVAQTAQTWAKEWSRPSGLEAPEWTKWLASLTLPSLLAVLDHLPDERIEVPLLHTDVHALQNGPVFANACESASWLADVRLYFALMTHPDSGRLVCSLCKSGTDHQTAEYMATASAELTIDPGVDKEETIRLRAVPQGRRYRVKSWTVLSSTYIGKVKVKDREETCGVDVRVAAEVVIPADVRRYELFGIWLLARGRSSVSLEEAILYLREEGEEAALERLVSLVAASFGRTLERWAELDLASFVAVLGRQDLFVKDERTVLDVFLKWSQGRSATIVDLVVPLVRFPLIHLIPIPADIKTLAKLSPVAKEVLEEALELQHTHKDNVTRKPKRYRVHGHDEPIEVKRHARAYCKDDCIRHYTLGDSLGL